MDNGFLANSLSEHVMPAARHVVPYIQAPGIASSIVVQLKANFIRLRVYNE